MRLMRKITDSDFFGGNPVFSEIISREGSRGVLVDYSTKFMILRDRIILKEAVNWLAGGVSNG